MISSQFGSARFPAQQTDKDEEKAHVFPMQSGVSKGLDDSMIHRVSMVRVDVIAGVDGWGISVLTARQLADGGGGIHTCDERSPGM